MVIVKAKEIQKSDILRCEAEINNLWGELNTANIPHSVRMELETTLSQCEERFNEVLGGQASLKQLEENLDQVDRQLALAAIKQAENEISKREHMGSVFQALENVIHQLNADEISAGRARHEVKEIMRHHS